MKIKKTITLVQQERCNGDMMSTSVLKNSRASSPAIFSKNFASGSILSISKNYLTQFILHSRERISFSPIISKNNQCYSTSTVLSKSSSTKIRPQFSHTMIFFLCLTSLCFWGGTALKHPPHESLSTGTTASPFR